MTNSFSRSISRYYQHQAYLRGVTSAEHVEVLCTRQAPLYNMLLTRHLNGRKTQNIVELACGPGIFLRYLHKLGFQHVTGIEMAECYLNVCREQGFSVQQADALGWLASQPPASIDVIIAIDFVEHLDKDSFVDFLDAVRAALSPQGLLLFRGPCGDSPFHGLNFFNDITHHTIFTTTAFTVLMKMCNLDVIEMLDECPANIAVNRWFMVPLSRIARYIFRKCVYAVSGHEIGILGPTMWVMGKPAPFDQTP